MHVIVYLFVNMITLQKSNLNNGWRSCWMHACNSDNFWVYTLLTSEWTSYFIVYIVIFWCYLLFGHKMLSDLNQITSDSEKPK